MELRRAALLPPWRRPARSRSSAAGRPSGRPRLRRDRCGSRRPGTVVGGEHPSSPSLASAIGRGRRRPARQGRGRRSRCRARRRGRPCATWPRDLGRRRALLADRERRRRGRAGVAVGVDQRGPHDVLARRRAGLQRERPELALAARGRRHVRVLDRPVGARQLAGGSALAAAPGSPQRDAQARARPLRSCRAAAGRGRAAWSAVITGPVPARPGTANEVAEALALAAVGADCRDAQLGRPGRQRAQVDRDLRGAGGHRAGRDAEGVHHVEAHGRGGGALAEIEANGRRPTLLDVDANGRDASDRLLLHGPILGRSAPSVLTGLGADPPDAGAGQGRGLCSPRPSPTSGSGSA